MAIRGAYIAVECTRLTLSAVEATLDASGVRVRSALHCPVPPDLDTEDTERMGQWVASVFAEAGLAAKRAVLVVPRSSVVLKKLTLPRPESRHDIPDLVHLAMTRQLTFGAKDAVVDYLEHGDGEAREGRDFTVLAAAVAGELLSWHLAVAKAARLRPVRVGLRSSGLAALLSDGTSSQEVGEEPQELRLAAEVDKREIGMIVLRGEELIFARATELSGNGEGDDAEEAREAYAAAVGTEVRRTWMSYRVTVDAGDIDRACVIGEHDLASRAAAQIQEAIGVPTRVFDLHPQIHADQDLPAGAWPLAGSLLQLWSGRPAVNFAKPRQAPDRTQALRQRALLVVAALIIVVGSAEVFVRKNLESLRSEVDTVRSQQREVTASVVSLLREDARLEHLKTWEQTRVDWLGHLAHLTGHMPTPRRATLNGFGGRADAAVVFDRPAGKTNYASGSWVPRVLVDLNLSGQAVNRDVADAVRGKFVEDPLYRCEPLGSDSGGKGGQRQPAKFGVKLLTVRTTPEPEETDDETAADATDTAEGGDAG